MPQRIEVNVQTGERTVIELTQAEIDEIAARPPAPVIDFSDPDNHAKAIKALGLVVAAWNGKTVPQLKAAFKTAWDSLP